MPSGSFLLADVMRGTCPSMLADLPAWSVPLHAQRIAVMWMQGREAASPAAAAQQQGQQADAVAAPHPFIHPICCSEVEADSAAAAFSATAGPGLPLWLDAASGEVVTEAPPALRAVRGGLFADEPGLGKTITAVSLWVAAARLLLLRVRMGGDACHVAA